MGFDVHTSTAEEDDDWIPVCRFDENCAVILRNYGWSTCDFNTGPFDDCGDAQETPNSYEE